ncbi:hypothetical protein L6164_017145 [Bauhinia variegata]|uniref:Uncharacterized protein n=1 Tax=Bauhinia variegata TaxID=167791 RepID=A0ACB9N6T0_BAUVA|nr:hypothetical protein L6164_017145 [Bauhinia variegata]
MNSTASPHVVIQISTVRSGLYGTPLLKYLPGDRKEHRGLYRKTCKPLYNLALQGNWKEASHMLKDYPELLTAAITKGWKTILHVAAGTHHVHFVQELVRHMDQDELELQDYNGNTALFSAATTGNLQIAEILVKNNESLPRIRGKESVFPVQLAALQGQSGMARYLYEKSSEVFEEVDYNKLFLACIKNGIYDLALEMSKTKRSLAFIQDEKEQTGLHILARKKFAKSCAKQTIVLQLVGHLCDVILSDEDSEEEIRSIIRDPIFDAAKVGNFEFIAQLLSTYHPADLMWELDDEDKSIIHIAVLHRHTKIFNLIHKEVKKMMQPSYIDKKNSDGLTPRELFSEEHQELFKKAESWMERTANSCILVSTVIATGVLAAAFSIPGGNDDDGIPHYLKKPAFLIFAVSDATALISASTSTLIFLSILMSRYAEDDFLSSLPMKLMFAMLALFLSITKKQSAAMLFCLVKAPSIGSSRSEPPYSYPQLKLNVSMKELLQNLAAQKIAA